MNDVRVIVTVKNAVMLRAMEAAGFETATALAKAANVGPSVVGLYLNLKLAPYDTAGNLRPSIQRIARAIGRLEEDLFPAQFLRRALATNRAYRDVSADEIPAIMGGDTQSIAYDPERSLVVQKALSALDQGLAALPPRYRRVVEMRYGLNGHEPHTLEETAAAFSLTRERIRQMQFSAERRMRDAKKGLRKDCAPILDGAL